ISLRFDSELPHSGAGPLEVLESLLECRKKADRLEGLYYKTLNLKGKLARKAALDIAEADDQWASALVQIKNSPIYKGDTFSGPRERYAEADLETFEIRRKARKSKELLSLAEEILDIVKTALRGLNDTRQDHLSWIRSLQFQSTLEN